MLNNIERKIRKIDWFLAHTRQLPLFTMDIAAYGYIKVSKKLFGWGFKHIMIISEKGIEESYRDVMDDQYFFKHYSKYESQKGKIIKRVSDDTAFRVKRLIKKLENLPLQLSDKELIKLVGLLKENYGRLAAVLGITRPVGIYYEKRRQNKKAHDFAIARGKQGELYSLIEKELEKLFLLLAKKWNIKSNLLCFLMADEIISHLKKGTKPAKKELKRRQNFYVLFSFTGGTFIIAGREARKIARAVRIKDIKHDSKADIKGNSILKGYAKGKVRIVMSENDLNKIKNKDVVVAPMTQVSFAPFLKNISAIITDEGGLTCHAAIISRELGVPCIVGTKIATKVLKDGQIVEVDANKGAVKII
ncbi:hypothetical protein KKC83_06095 [Patescibacteria group bacterium]|nr:hypothetical protein [Candidatus Falkowbacteria bacterium]MBU3906447.1 hypothetical protein [Patescibacteria group bacterium]MBU4014743.1 hypothetical protein [Patescibacteria group bacterium]MBU4027083.1 hypothetical protein [Patescibacteria group bacterium]MBU4073626.1 hypothetical protein [Patescibacteria group bacterium]